MRGLLFALAAALAAISLGQAPTGFRPDAGTYQTPGGTPAPWSVDASGRLIWNGQPYLPVGAEVGSDLSRLDALAAAGVKDVVVDLPASGKDWAATFDRLEKGGFLYLVRITSSVPAGRGTAVEPQSYRLPGIVANRPYIFNLPGARSAYVVLAATRDGAVLDQRRVPVQDGQAVYDATLASEGNPGVLLVYPELDSLSQPDMWGALDAHRDALLAAVAKSRPGPGLRGWVDPLGATTTLPGRDARFVPSSPLFRLEVKRFLIERYRTLETAARTWALGPSVFSIQDITDENDPGRPLASWDDLSRLVPLWSSNRGLPLLLDPSTDRVFPVDQRRTAIWRDLQEVMANAYAKRYARLVETLRAATDVPVLQTWSGWSGAYESTATRLTGVAFALEGTSPAETAERASRPASSLLRWRHPGWLVCTSYRPDKADGAATTLEDLAAFGARAVYLRAGDPAILAAALAGREAFTGASASRLDPVYFPENATNPARAQRLPGGRVWLPSPTAGDRLDLGERYFGYRTPTGFALWTDRPGRTKLLLTDVRGVTFQSLDGSSPDPKPVKGGLEITLGELPLFVEGTSTIPVPEPALAETVSMGAKYLTANETARRDLSQEAVLYQTLISGLAQNPGGNFPQLRSALRQMAYNIGDWTWVEGEGSSNTNFSDIPEIPGASNGRVLALQAAFTPDAGAFAEYVLPVRSEEDQTVWLAARLPADRVSDVQIVIGGQLLTASGPPVGRYGTGFGWYRFGVTRLKGPQSRLRLQIARPVGSEFLVDAILLCPGDFTPAGLRVPDRIAPAKPGPAMPKLPGSGGSG